MTNFAYDDADRVTDIVHHTGTLDGQSPLSDYGLLGLGGDAGLLAFYHLAYRADGRIDRIDSADGRASYGYDAVGELTSAAYSVIAGRTAPPNEDYKYDATGNRVVPDSAAAETPPIVTGANNRLTNDGTYSYQYDAQGNRVGRTKLAGGEAGTTEIYEWDAAGRLKRVHERASSSSTADVKTIDYVYDMLGRRVAKLVDEDGSAAFGGGTGHARAEYAVWDDVGNDIVLEFADDDVTDTIAAHIARRNLWGGGSDELLAVEEAGGQAGGGTQNGTQTLWALADNNSNNRDVVSFTPDGAGGGTTSVTQHYIFDSFGQLAPIGGNGDPAVMPYFFAGQEYDGETGLTYMDARYYDSFTHQFISPDPINADPNNTFRYVGNDPISHTDPTGLAETLSPEMRDWWWRFGFELRLEMASSPDLPGQLPYEVQLPEGEETQKEERARRLLHVWRPTCMHCHNNEVMRGFVPWDKLSEDERMTMLSWNHRASDQYIALSILVFHGPMAAVEALAGIALAPETGGASLYLTVDAISGLLGTIDAGTEGEISRHYKVRSLDFVQTFHNSTFGDFGGMVTRQIAPFAIAPFSGGKGNVPRLQKFAGVQILADAGPKGFEIHVGIPSNALRPFEIHVGQTNFAPLKVSPSVASPIVNLKVMSFGLGLDGEVKPPTPSTGVRSANPSRSVVQAAEPIGPGIGRSNFRTIEEFRDAVFERYQHFYDQADAIAQARIASGRLPNDPTVVGGYMDRFARTQLRDWLASEGIYEGPGGIIEVNRWLRDPTGSGEYRIPDVRIPGANVIFDGTIGTKSGSTPQVIDFQGFSGGDKVIIVRPSRIGGSYGIVP